MLYKYQILKVVGPEREVLSSLREYKDLVDQIGIGYGISVDRQVNSDGTVTYLFSDIYSIHELKFTELIRHLGRKLRAAISGNKYFGRTIVIDVPLQ